MMSCPSQRTEISVCACSAWRDLARLGELTRLKRLHEKKLARPRGSPSLANRVTLPPGSLYPRARFAVSHVNGRRLFLSNCRGGCQLFSIQTGFSRLFVGHLNLFENGTQVFGGPTLTQKSVVSTIRKMLFMNVKKRMKSMPKGPA